MGHHGWQGNPPRTEDEARQRIITATMTCVEQFGPAKTTLSDVAAELGVTRQTVYRYYANLADLLSAVAQAGTRRLRRAHAEPPRDRHHPGRGCHRVVVFAVQAIPNEPYIGLLFQAGETDVFSRGVTSSMAVSVGAHILRSIRVDWSEVGVDDDELEGLAEILMRLFVSFLQYPADPPRSEDELRSLVRRWLGPALRT